MTLELLTITGHAPAIMGDDLTPFTHQLHGYREGLTYTIPLQGGVPAWLTNYPKINGAATQEIKVVLTVAGPPPKVVNIGKLDMSTPLHGEDPDRAMLAWIEPIARLAEVPETRLKGRDLSIQIFKDNVLQDKLALIKDIVVTFADGVLVEFTAHQDCADYIDLMEAANGGAKYSMNLTLLFPNGQARTFVMERLDFKVIKLSAIGDKGMVELHFTVRAGTYKVLS